MLLLMDVISFIVYLGMVEFSELEIVVCRPSQWRGTLSCYLLVLWECFLIYVIEKVRHKCAISQISWNKKRYWWVILDFTKSFFFSINALEMLERLLISLHSWAGVRHHTSGAVFPVHRDMPSSGGAIGALLFVRSGAGSSDLSSSTSSGSSGACAALQRAGSPGSSRRGSFLWDGSTRCSPLSGSTTGRWCVGRSATRWDALSPTARPFIYIFGRLWLSVKSCCPPMR